MMRLAEYVARMGDRSEKLKGRDNSEDLAVDGKMILKWRVGRRAKGGEFLDYWLLKKDSVPWG
jgi:hypothetical protein